MRVFVDRSIKRKTVLTVVFDLLARLYDADPGFANYIGANCDIGFVDVFTGIVGLQTEFGVFVIPKTKLSHLYIKYRWFDVVEKTHTETSQTFSGESPFFSMPWTPHPFFLHPGLADRPVVEVSDKTDFVVSTLALRLEHEQKVLSSYLKPVNNSDATSLKSTKEIDSTRWRRWRAKNDFYISRVSEFIDLMTYQEFVETWCNEHTQCLVVRATKRGGIRFRKTRRPTKHVAKALGFKERGEYDFFCFERSRLNPLY